MQYMENVRTVKEIARGSIIKGLANQQGVWVLFQVNREVTRRLRELSGSGWHFVTGKQRICGACQSGSPAGNYYINPHKGRLCLS